MGLCRHCTVVRDDTEQCCRPRQDDFVSQSRRSTCWNPTRNFCPFESVWVTLVSDATTAAIPSVGPEGDLGVEC